MYRINGENLNTATHGYFWSASLSMTPPYVRYMIFHGDDVSPESGYYKTNGYSVCYATAANDTLHQFPFSLPYSGLVYRSTGVTSYQGQGGYLWSGGITSTTKDLDLSFYASFIDVEAKSYKTSGFTVRCVVVLFYNIIPC